MPARYVKLPTLLPDGRSSLWVATKANLDVIWTDHEHSNLSKFLVFSYQEYSSSLGIPGMSKPAMIRFAFCARCIFSVSSFEPAGNTLISCRVNKLFFFSQQLINVL